MELLRIANMTSLEGPDDAKPINSYIFDPSGDLTLVVGLRSDTEPEFPWRFTVCSATLRRASLVWNKMLYGGWAESKKTTICRGSSNMDQQEDDQWTVELPEDDPKALAVVMNIIHGHFDKVPAATGDEMTIELLYDVLVACNKYDLTKIVRPWIKGWMEIAKRTPDTTETPSDRSSFTIYSTYIAWEVGDEDLFKARFIELCKHVEVNEDGHLAMPGNIDLTKIDHIGPSDLVDIITLSRSIVIQYLLDWVHDQIDRRSRPGVSYCFMVNQASEYDRRICNDVILAGMYKAIIPHQQGRHLPRQAAEIQESVTVLVNWLIPELRSVWTLARHEGCNFFSYETCEDLEEYLERHVIVQIMEPKVIGFPTDNHKSYMAAQREKTGYY